MSKIQRTICIGDIHGCAAEFQDVLEACNFSPDRDALVLVGDLIAKGPDPHQVIKRARELNASAVLGNHEQRLLDWKYAQEQQQSAPPLQRNHRHTLNQLEYEDWLWLRTLPYFIELHAYNVVCVHAALIPNLPLSHQPREVMLTIRSRLPDGTLSPRSRQGEPWAATWPGPQHVVFGHDATRGLQQYPYATGIDTGCVYGGKLTALILPEHQLVQVDAHRAWAPTGAPVWE